MKKRFVCILLLIVTCLSLFAYGTAEQQKEFFETLPQLIQDSATPIAPSNQYPNAITTTAKQKEVARTNSGSNLIEEQMQSLAMLYKYIDQKFLYDIDYQKVYESMASAMFEALGDEYSVFVPIEEEEDYELSMNRQYAGAGFVLSKYYPEYQDPEKLETIYCKLTQVYPNTPAAKAGLKAGDLITHIDGNSVIDLASEECSKRIKGEKGTTVVLTILRNGTTFDVNVVRDIITIPELYYCMLDDNIGYLYILQFISGTDVKVKQAILDLQNQGMEKLVIDLRDNPGGLVETTLKIADMFLPGGKPLMVTNFIAQQTINWSSSVEVLDQSTEIAILVNGGSASSSEILAAALKDNNRAVLIGDKTFGKGISQTSGIWGNNEFKLTTASFVTPNGNEIQKVGLTPDFEVENVYVLEEELDEYAELQQTSLISDYVDSHPEFTRQNIEGFADTLPDSGLRDIILHILVRNEYVDRMNTDDAPICDPVYDLQLAKAIEYLKGTE